MFHASATDRSPHIAVIDIGSNSMHLVVMGMDAMGKLATIDSEKIVLRLGETLDAEGNLPLGTRTTIIDSLGLLQEIANCYQPLLRIIATHAIRDARNHSQLLAEIKDQLGLDVHIIDGNEEARLVALGMHYASSLQEKPFFGADIGGGSSELLMMAKGKITSCISIPIGTVTLNHRFLKDTTDLTKSLAEAERLVEEHLVASGAQFRNAPREAALLSSSVGKTLVELAAYQGSHNRISDPHGHMLTAATIDAYYAQLVQLASPEKIRQHWDLPPHKAEILLAGTCILRCLTRHMGIAAWTISTYGMREGLVLDVLESLGCREQIKRHGQQIAWFNVQSLSRHLQVDQVQAQRVSDFAMDLFDQLQAWSPVPLGKESAENLRKILRAAAWLHECGKLVHFTRYHRHSSYLIINSQLMGFTEREKHFIALIARSHKKGKLSRKDPDFKILDDADLKKINYLSAILRLAVAAHRSRQGHVKGLTVEKAEHGINLLIKGRRLKAVSLDFQKIIRDKDTLELCLNLPISCNLETRGKQPERALKSYLQPS